MPDVDLPKAEHVLSVLRRARLSRNETAATMIAELVYEMAYTGSRAPEIEEARQAAWIEISLSNLPNVGRSCCPRVIRLPQPLFVASKREGHQRSRRNVQQCRTSSFPLLLAN